MQCNWVTPAGETGNHGVMGHTERRTTYRRAVSLVGMGCTDLHLHVQLGDT